MHEVWAGKVVCNANTMPGVVNCPHCEDSISSRGFSFMSCLVVVQDESWAILCWLIKNMQDMNQTYHISQVELRNRRNSSIVIPCTRLHLHSLLHPCSTHCQHSEVSRDLMTCTKQHLSFQFKPDNLQSFVCSLWASICYMQLYHNANASDVDSYSTHSDSTKGQPQRRGEGNC